MIISKRVYISGIIKGGERSVITILLISVGSYFLNEYVVAKYFTFPSVIPTVLGTALAFFIGFNSNQAYDRWREARKIWGALVNDSRTWARLIQAYTNPNDDINASKLAENLQSLVYRHIAFVYSLKENLRESNDKEYKKYLSEDDFEKIKHKSNSRNVILNLQSNHLKLLFKQGVIGRFRFVELNKLLAKFTDHLGQSERIKKTVFPVMYHNYTQIFIWILVMSITIVTSLSAGYWSILVGFLIGIVFIITHKLGLVLLNPFDEIKSGIPLNQISRTIEIDLLETLDETDIPEPVSSVNGRYIM